MGSIYLSDKPSLTISTELQVISKAIMSNIHKVLGQEGNHSFGWFSCIVTEWTLTPTEEEPKYNGKERALSDSSGRWPEGSRILTATETVETTVQTHSHNHDISAAIKKAKNLYCDIKDVLDELNILKSMA